MNSIGIAAAILGLKKILRHWTTSATFACWNRKSDTLGFVRHTNNCSTLPRPNYWWRRMDKSFSDFTQDDVCSDPLWTENRCFLCCKENTRKKEQKHGVDGIFCRFRLEG